MKKILSSVLAGAMLVSSVGVMSIFADESDVTPVAIVEDSVEIKSIEAVAPVEAIAPVEAVVPSEKDYIGLVKNYIADKAGYVVDRARLLKQEVKENPKKYALIAGTAIVASAGTVYLGCKGYNYLTSGVPSPAAQEAPAAPIAPVAPAVQQGNASAPVAPAVQEASDSTLAPCTSAKCNPSSQSCRSVPWDTLTPEGLTNSTNQSGLSFVDNCDTLTPEGLTNSTNQSGLSFVDNVATMAVNGISRVATIVGNGAYNVASTVGSGVSSVATTVGNFVQGAPMKVWGLTSAGATATLMVPPSRYALMNTAVKRGGIVLTGLSIIGNLFAPAV